MPDHRPTSGPARFTTSQFERFFAEVAPRVRRAVAINVRTNNTMILDDACQHAWLSLSAGATSS